MFVQGNIRVHQRIVESIFVGFFSQSVILEDLRGEQTISR